MPLDEWRMFEKEWTAKITSKEASDDPRTLVTLENPYEPKTESGEIKDKVLISSFLSYIFAGSSYSERSGCCTQ